MKGKKMALIEFSHTLEYIDAFGGEAAEIVDVEAEATVRHGARYDSPLGPLGEAVIIEDVRLVSVRSEEGHDIMARLAPSKVREIKLRAEELFEQLDEEEC